MGCWRNWKRVQRERRPIWRSCALSAGRRTAARRSRCWRTWIPFSATCRALYRRIAQDPELKLDSLGWGLITEKLFADALDVGRNYRVLQHQSLFRQLMVKLINFFKQLQVDLAKLKVGGPGRGSLSQRCAGEEKYLQQQCQQNEVCPDQLSHAVNLRKGVTFAARFA